MRKFTAIVAIAFQISPSWSASYYVSPDGNDANSGTDPTAPWQTIAKVNAATFGPGDTVSFKGGASFAGNLVINASGSASAPLVINSYETGKATVVAGTGYGIVLDSRKLLRRVQGRFPPLCPV